MRLRSICPANATRPIANLKIAHKITTVLLKSFFLSCVAHNVLISTPLFTVSEYSEPSNKLITTSVKSRVIIRAFYYASLKPKNNKLIGALHNSRYNSTISTSFFDSTLKLLGKTISGFYPEGVRLELSLVRIHQPYSNASILAQYLAINASKYGFHRIVTILLALLPFVKHKSVGLAINAPVRTVCLKAGGGKNYSSSSYPQLNNFDTGMPLFSSIVGVKVQLSGLLTTQRMPARKTVYSASAGTLNSSTKNSVFTKTVTNYACYSSKSRAGAFNVKV